jgi:hypothetical protein
MEIIDFTIEYQDQLSIGRNEGLIGIIGRVQNGQSGRSQHHRTVLVRTLVVRTAMAQGCRHLDHILLISLFSRPTVQIKDAANPAHQL